MSASLTKHVAAALTAVGLACAGPAVTPAAAAHHHGWHGGHYHHGGGWGRHYAWRARRHYGYGGGYYGGPYYGGGYYAAPYYGGYYAGPPCLPVLGLVTGNFCNYY